MGCSAAGARRGAPASLDDATYEELGSAISLQRWFIWIALAVIAGTPVAAYIGTILFLILAGWTLSRLTLRAASRLPTETSGRAVGMAGWLRWTYRGVLWLCCAFYYASLPLIVIGMILLVAAVFLMFLAIGIVPIKLMLIIGLVAIVTIGAILKSLFVRVRDEDPGPRLDVSAHPRFAALLAEVAGRVRTRPVDSVFLTPGTDIAVTERGGFFRQLRRKTDRTLILGIAVLEGMSTQELKAILAHEHGHFRNEDTAGGSFALAARRSLLLMAIGLVRGGVASKLNPAWWFTILVSKVFARISQGASRLQEVLADRWAAYAYGSEAFVSGLRHVIAASVRFDAQADATLKEVVEGRTPLANFYRYAPARAADEGEIDRAIEEALAREPTAYDSHPAPRDRIAWVTALGTSGEGAADASDAWSLFADREALERLLTAEIRQNLAMAYGVAIPDGSASDDAA
jgi:Zn-dependent protease with chaperone function